MWQGGVGGMTTKGQEETFGGEGCVHYLECGDGSVCVCICQSLSHRIL